MFAPSTTNLLIPILVLVLAVGLFLLCREILCWYWKINRIEDLLQQLVTQNADNNKALRTLVAASKASLARQLSSSSIQKPEETEQPVPQP